MNLKRGATRTAKVRFDKLRCTPSGPGTFTFAFNVYALGYGERGLPTCAEYGGCCSVSNGFELRSTGQLFNEDSGAAATFFT